MNRTRTLGKRHLICWRSGAVEQPVHVCARVVVKHFKLAQYGEGERQRTSRRLCSNGSADKR